MENLLHNTVVLPTAYLGSIEYFSSLLKHPNIFIEAFEYFEKQTIRNSCNIFAANGPLKLSVPLSRRKNKTLTKDIKIDYATSWQLHHMRSIESAYRSAPFFEYYWDYFLPLYNNKYQYLIELNNEATFICLKLLKEAKDLQTTLSYLENTNNAMDSRNLESFKKTALCELNFKSYPQVFSPRLGFIKNLSLIDLLFNQGNESRSYLLHH